MSDSRTFSSRAFAARRRLCLWGGAFALLLAACSKSVVVEGVFPPPLLDKLPYTIGVYYSPEFRNHEFFDDAGGRGEADWLVRTGEAQIEMYDKLLPGMFEKVTPLDAIPGPGAAAGEEVDAVLVPYVDELQYSIPSHSRLNVFEIWMRYRYELYAPDGELLADWTMTAYGKTPTAFLQGAEAAVNLAAVVALRDAGANFALNFAGVPEVRLWMESMAERGDSASLSRGDSDAGEGGR